MSNEIDKAECPFSGHGEELVNVKFFRGRRDDVITAHEIKEESRKAVMQHRLQEATVSREAPRSTRPSINVAEFVAAL
jgi:hypothetical protein